MNSSLTPSTTISFSKSFASSAWITLVIAGLFSCYNLFQMTWFNVISTELLSRYHLTMVAVGLLHSAFFWGNALAIIPLGILLDRQSVRQMALILLALTTLVDIVLAVIPGYWFCVILRFCQGISSAASLLISMRVAILLFPNRANQSTCIIGIFSSFGGIVGNALFARVYHATGLSMSLIVSSLLGCSLWLWMWFGFKFSRLSSANYTTNKADTREQPLSIFDQLKSAIKQPINLYAGCYLGLINTPVLLLGSLWGGLYFSKASGQSVLVAADLSSLLFFGLMIGALLFAGLTKSLIKARGILVLSSIMLLIVINYLFYNKHAQLHDLVILTMLIGVLSSCQNLVYPYIRYHNSLSSLSTAMSVAALVFNLIVAVIQPTYSFLIGEINDLQSISCYYYNAVLLVACLLIINIVTRDSTIVQQF